jgi:outer membrane lipoprotein-sorting protein
MKVFKVLPFVLAMLLVGCSHSSIPTFNQMMEDMIVFSYTAELPNSYYLETGTTLYENNKIIKKETIHRWYETASARERMETHIKGEPVHYSVFNGKERLIYTEGQPKAFVQKEESNQSFIQGPTIHSVLQMLQQDSSTHTIKLIGEETIDNAKTYHIKMKAKEENTIFGERQLWIDQETWMLKKIISQMGNVRQETLFQHYQANPELPTDKFSLELPNGVEIVREGILENKVSQLEEIKTYWGQTFFHYPDTDGVALQSIDQTNDVFTLTYTKNDQLFFTITMKKTDVELTGDYLIRGKRSAELEKIPGLGHSLSWIEEGIHYTILDLANIFTENEILGIAEKMKKYRN